MSRSSSGNTVVFVILGIIVGLGLLGLVACGGLMFMFYRAAAPAIAQMGALAQDIVDSQEAVKSFQTALQTNQVAGAYESTTTDFRNRMTLQQLEEFARKNPTLKEATDLSDAAPDFNFEEGVGDRITYDLRQPAKTYPEFTIVVAREGGRWKVHSIERNESEKVCAAAEAFLNNLGAKWNDAAYQLTTADFRRDWGRQKLDEFSRKHPLPRRYKLHAEKDPVEPNHHLVTIRTEDDLESVAFYIHVRKEGNSWKVADLREDDE